MRFLKQAQGIALCIFFFSINFEIYDPFDTDNDFSLAKLTAMIYFITVIPQLKQFIRIDNLKSILLPLWFFFGLLTIMGLINANEFYPEFFETPIFLNILLFWFIINHVRKDYFILEKAMLSFALGSVTLAILFIADIGVVYIDGRLSMFGSNANNIGLRISISSIILFVTVIQNRLNLGSYRYVILLLLPFMLRVIAETGSRLSTISFILAFVIGITLYKSKYLWSKILLITGGILFISFLTLWMLNSEILKERLLNTVNSKEVGGRDEIWIEIFPLLKENPVFGVGITGYRQFATYIYGETFSPHNVILEVLCYTGIIGLSFYLIFLYQIFKRSYLSYKNNGILLPLLLILPVIGLILGGQILDVKFGWIIFAYIICSSAVKIEVNPIKMLKNENFMRN